MEQLSKEDILFSFPRGESEPYGHIPVNRIYEAMENYAKQTAIALIEFIEDGNYKPANNGGYWKATKNGAAIDYCSSEELYELFLQSINK